MNPFRWDEPSKGGCHRDPCRHHLPAEVPRHRARCRGGGIRGLSGGRGVAPQLLPVARPGRPLRPVRPAPQGPSASGGAGQMSAHEEEIGPGRGDRPAHPGGAQTARAPRGTGHQTLRLGGAEGASSPQRQNPPAARGGARRPHGRRHRPGRSQGHGALRVLPVGLPERAIWSAWTPSTWASSKGSGPIYQLTAVDTATRWAICSLVVGHVSGEVMGAFVHHVAEELWTFGTVLTGVLTDNGPEFRAQAFGSGARRARGDPPPDPAALSEPQRRGRAVPRHGPAGVLPTRLSPSPVRSAGGPGRAAAGLAGALQPPLAQPRRLHERTDPEATAGGRWMIDSRVRHLSPQPVSSKF